MFRPTSGEVDMPGFESLSVGDLSLPHEVSTRPPPPWDGGGGVEVYGNPKKAPDPPPPPKTGGGEKGSNRSLLLIWTSRKPSSVDVQDAQTLPPDPLRCPPPYPGSSTEPHLAQKSPQCTPQGIYFPPKYFVSFYNLLTLLALYFSFTHQMKSPFL